MKVDKPQINYDITFTEKETVTILDCCDIVIEILNKMSKYNCEMLDYGYVGDCEYIEKDKLKSVRDVLESLSEVHTMF